jgi:hypothetical protein
MADPIYVYSFVIYGFLGLGNIGLDTITKFLSSLLADI